MKRGFTLIELLAVIVILAIIALIAVPIVINIINDTKIESQKRSIDMYAKAVEQAVARYTMNTGKVISGQFTTTDGKKLVQGDITIEVDYDGNVIPENIVVYNNGKIYLSNSTVDGTKTDYVYAEKIKNMLIESENKEPATDEDKIYYTFLNTNIKSGNIETFQTHTNGINIPTGYDSTDCSYNQDKSVMCYWKEIETDPGYYEMHIAANGEIYTPYDSTNLFYRLGYEKLEALDLNDFNTKYTVNMDTMFQATGYTKMTILNLGNKFDTSNVTNMDTMFQRTGYTKLESLNLGDKFDTSNVTNMRTMFQQTGYTKMTTLNLRDKFDTSKVTNMNSMFSRTGYKLLTSLDLGDKFDTSNVTDMNSMFFRTGRESLITLNLRNKFTIPNNVDTTAMFSYCGTNGVLTNVIVPSEELKTKILGLGTDKVPQFWSTNNIIQVQTN